MLHFNRFAIRFAIAVVACSFLAATASSASASAAACGFAPDHLTVDFLPSPAAASLPRLSAARAPLLGWRAASLLAPGARGNLTQGSFRVVVATSPALLPDHADVFDSGVVASPTSVAVPYGGPALAARARVFWQVALWDAAGASCGFGAETSSWEVPPLADADWAGAEWLTRDAPHAPAPDCAYYNNSAAPLLRARFALAQPAASVARARLYVAGLGYFTPFLDGAQVGDEALAPGWTDFNSSVLFSTFDVTAALAAGGPDHVIGVALGNGWWNLVPLLFWGHQKFATALPHGDPMARVHLAVDFADDSTQHVVSDSSSGAWRVGGSEVLFNSLYLGTRVDRRLEPVGWSTAAFDASAWPAPHAAVVAGFGELVSQSVPPVRRQAPLPVALLASSSSASELTLDIGRQISGVCSFCFDAIAAGAKIDFRYGELLYPNGSVNGMTSVAGQVKGGNGGECAPQIAFAEDHYTARGDAGGECFTPQWTWHAARYVMVTGDAAALAALSVARTQCHPLRSDVAQISSFEASDPLLNAIHTLALNTFENNIVSVQSDCPHRERLGYTGDALMSGESFMQNFDMATFYSKRLDDVVAAQRANGGITETAPFVGIADAGIGGGSGPIGWQTYFPVAAEWLYKYYGNAAAVQRAYGAATRYVEFLDSAPRSAIENGLVSSVVTQSHMHQ